MSGRCGPTTADCSSYLFVNCAGTDRQQMKTQYYMRLAAARA